MGMVSQAITDGNYGYRTGTFLPPNTKDIFVTDVEAVWLDQETPMQMLEKVERTFDHERGLGLVRPPSRPVDNCSEELALTASDVSSPSH
jgi:raffinose/stachyose/melibiose transport system substrate-binding protein